MARKPTRNDMLPVVGGNGKPHLRVAKRGNWTKEKEREFPVGARGDLQRRPGKRGSGNDHPERLLATAQERGVPGCVAETLAAAYQRLELVLIERTLNGTEKIMQRHDGTEDRMREYSNNLGLALLKLHRSTAETVARPAAIVNGDDARERLLKKLLRLKKRRQK